MTPEQQLIQQLRQVLATNQLDNRIQLDALADQFSDLCRNANERLLRCSDYLSKGRRSEAIYEATLAPNLLTLADELSGDWLKKWNNVTLDLELTTFQPLNFTLVEQLKKEFQSEQSLEPLLKEYRRCVYQSDHRRCIELLRKIRQQDPDNPNWEKNLRPLEEGMLPEWLERCERGLESMDLAELRIVFEELNHPQRVVKPPEDIMRRLRRALMSERAQDLHMEGELLLAKVKAAMDRQDVSELDTLWKQCSELELDEAFLQRPDNWSEVLSGSHRLAEKLGQEKTEREGFDQAVSHLKDLLMDSSVSPVELRHDYERLETWGLPIPKLLVRQVNERLTEQRNRKRNKILLTGFAVVLVIAVVGGISAWKIQRTQQQAARAEWLARAEQYSHSGSLKELETLLEEIRLADTAYYGSHELAGIREDLTQARLTQERKERDYIAFKSTLEDIRNTGYRGDHDSIVRALNNAKAVATSKEEKGYVVRWQNEWVRFSAQQERDMAEKIMPKLTAIQTALGDLRTGAGQGLETEHEMVKELLADLHRLDEQKVMLAGKSVRDLHGVLKGKLQARLADVQQRKVAFEKKLADQQATASKVKDKLAVLRQDLPRALPNFVRYETLLKEFVSLGKGSQEATDYASVLANLAKYQSVVALRGLIPADGICSRGMGEVVERLLVPSSPLSNSIWQGDLERVRQLSQANRELQRKASTLISLRKDNMYALKFRRIGTEAWSLLYSDRPFQSQQKDGLTYYWGNAYWAADEESHVILTPTSQLNHGTTMTSRDFEVILSRTKQDNLAAHVRVMKKLVAEAMRSEDVAVYLLGELEKLRADREVDPVQGLLIFKRFVNLLSQYCLEELPESKVWSEQANQISTDIPWQRATHPRTLEARAQIAKFWKAIPDLRVIRRRLEMNHQLLQTVLRTDLRCVGSVQCDAKGKKVLFPCDSASEYWLYRPAGVDNLSSFTILRVDSSGKLLAGQLSGCSLGTPVFAPRSGRETMPVLRRIREEAGQDFGKLLLPRAWPSVQASH